MPEQLPTKIGHYRIVATVGPWMWGWFYRGRDEARGRDVWVKTLSPGLAHESWARQRFRNEARATARMSHPNIITIFEFGESEGVVFIASEALDGRSLFHAMNAEIDLKVGLPVVFQVLTGLAHIHLMGIVHRQIRPSNIFLCTDGRVKIMNFSVCGLISAAPSPPPVPSVAMLFDLSPEIVVGDGCDGRSDLFSVGCLLYEMVTGQKPFRDESATALLSKVVTEEPDMALLPDRPDWKRLRGVIIRALRKNPEERYPDALAMRADLELALKELGDNADWRPPSRDVAGARSH